MRRKKLKYKLRYYKINKSNIEIKKIIILTFVIFIAILFIFLFIKIFTENELFVKFRKVDENKIFNNLKILYYEGNYDEILYNIDKYLNNRIIRSKKGINELSIIKTHLLLLKNEFDKAFIFLKKYKKYFEEEEYTFLYSFLLLKSGKAEKSLKYLDSVLNKHKKYENRWKNCYILYSYLNFIQYDLPKAIENLNKIKNKDNIVYYNLAYLYYLNNQLNNTLKTLYKISENNNIKLNVKVNLLTAKILFKIGNYKESNIYLDKIKNIGIDYDTYYYNYLLNLFFLKDKKDIKKYLKLIKNYNFFYEFYSLLFISLYAIEDCDNAKLVYENYLNSTIEKKIKGDDFDQKDLLNYLIYCDLLINSNLNRVAINFFERILNLNFNKSDILKIYRIYISLLLKENLLKKAESIIMKNQKILFDDSYFVKIMIDIYIKQKNYEKGIEFIKEYFKPETNPFEFYFLQAYLYRKINNYSNSNELLFNLLKMINDNKEKDDIYKIVAKNYMDLKLYLKANEFLDKINNKNDKEYLKLRFKNYFYLNDWDNLVITGKRILLTEKNKSLIYFYIGYGYYKREDYKQALYYFKNSLEKCYEKKFRSIISVYIGNCYAYLKDYANSFFYFNQVKLIDPSNLYGEINIEKLNQGEKYGK